MKKYVVELVLLIYLLISCDTPKPIANPTKNMSFSERCRQLVLKENKRNQKFKFIKQGNAIDEQVIDYIGYIISKKDTIKVLNYVHYTGLYQDSRRGNGQLFLYNNDDEIIGSYNFGSALAIPTSIQGTNIVFSYNNTSCNQVTKIDLKGGIPKQIFIRCTVNGGDLYDFNHN